MQAIQVGPQARWRLKTSEVSTLASLDVDHVAAGNYSGVIARSAFCDEAIA
jgi:hypothetical protein